MYRSLFFLRMNMEVSNGEYKVCYVCNGQDKSNILLPYDRYKYVDIHRNISFECGSKNRWFSKIGYNV